MKASFDTELLDAIRSGGRRLETAMHDLLHSGWKEGIGAYVRARGGNRQDGEDVFQDGIRHLIMNVRAGRFNGKSSLKTYLSSICKNLWHTRFSRAVKLGEIKHHAAPETPYEPGPEQLFLQKERSAVLEKLLAQLGEKCKQVLGRWSLGFSFAEIGALTGKAEGTVRKQKHDCLKRLTGLLKDKPELVAELLS